MESFDQGMWNWLQARRSPELDRAMAAAGYLGRTWFLAAVAIGILVWLMARRRGRRAVFFTAACVGAYLLGRAVAPLIGRAPPEVVIRPVKMPEGPFSFPSASVLLATAVYGFVGAAVAERWGGWLVGCGFGLLILAIGVSRLLLGVNYPTDVLFAWLAGLAWVLACRWGEARWAE